MISPTLHLTEQETEAQRGEGAAHGAAHHGTHSAMVPECTAEANAPCPRLKGEQLWAKHTSSLLPGSHTSM